MGTRPSARLNRPTASLRCNGTLISGRGPKVRMARPRRQPRCSMILARHQRYSAMTKSVPSLTAGSPFLRIKVVAAAVVEDFRTAFPSVVAAVAVRNFTLVFGCKFDGRQHGGGMDMWPTV